ncbi:hypothetical protein [Sphaerisporangium fuscum]|uniref:hypothetical protein n=1 Tax=Sphaerisporangium fuscum TaxID=2835868 RepID=UPI001BDD69DC|nr:hypothetical protein [Sphaerisporangium fuscum]
MPRDRGEAEFYDHLVSHPLGKRLAGELASRDIPTVVGAAGGVTVICLGHRLMAFTDGSRIWWTSPHPSARGRRLCTYAVTVAGAAARLADHYAVVRSGPPTDEEPDGTMAAVGRRFKAAPSPEEPPKAPRAGRPRWLYGIVALLLTISAAATYFGWNRYIVATVQPPRLTSAGSVTVYVPPDVWRIEPQSVTARMNLTADYSGARLYLRIHPRARRPTCVPYMVELYGSASLAPPTPLLINQGVEIEGNTWRRTAGAMLVRGSACPGRIADGQEPSWLYGTVGWPLAGPTVMRQGSWMALSIPPLRVWTVGKKDFADVLRDFDNGSPRGFGTAVGVGADCTVDLGPLGPVDRLEAVAPPLDGPGLRWLTCERPMTALLVSIPVKADADRALFWAGLLGGLAFSLLLFIAQLLIDPPGK